MSIYERIGVKTVINAAENFTALGGSLMPKKVLDAMFEIAQSYVVIEDLLERASETIAEVTGAEAGFVTSGAAAGMVLATASCITGKDHEKMRRLPNTEGMKNEVIIQKVKRCIWDQYITMAGAKIVELDSEGTTITRARGSAGYYGISTIQLIPSSSSFPFVGTPVFLSHPIIP